MKVTLTSHTPDALNVLLRTKSTRLAHNEDPATWPEEKKAEHLAYMRDTIKSSWEFIDYIFLIEGVTRAFTHQFVRTRTGSYAQESQRTVDVSDHKVVTPDFKENADPMAAEYIWGNAEASMLGAYAALLAMKVPVQDARGILPTNITTSITAKFNLRTLSDMAKLRLCVRTQGEYQQVFRKMREAVLAVHPWAAEFLEVHCVATGTCAFPRYGKTSCQFYDPRMDLEALRSDVKKKFWSEEAIPANPIAKDGRTM
jgi:flavin-dependent thymidylate synthase